MKVSSIFLGIGVVVLAVSALPSTSFANAGNFDGPIADASRKYGIPKSIIKGIIAVESGFRPSANNPNSSATGLMQLTRAAAADTFTPYELLGDPAINIDAGAAYLAKMRDVTGSIYEAIVAYHDGPGNWRNNIDVGGKEYRVKVLKYSAAFALGI